MIVAEQDCPVCTSPIELHVDPFRWIHTFGTCTSTSYQKLCDPNPFASTFGTPRSRALIRGKARQQLYRNRVGRSNPNSLMQRMKDDL